MKIKLLPIGANKNNKPEFAVLNKRGEALTIVEEFGQGYYESKDRPVYFNVDALNCEMVRRFSLK